MKTWTLLLSGMFLAVGLQAQIRHVPSQYATIQDGINAANPGDTVLVAEGTYYEQIHLTGHKPILVGSNYIMDGDQSHISHTVIDGSQLPTGIERSVVYFGSGNDTTSILCGFTIRNGKGTRFTVPDGDILAGGGIFISGGGAKILHNIISNNFVNDQSISGNQYFVAGGGIYSSDETTGHWTVIESNQILNNTATAFHHQAYGGGVCVNNNTRFYDNDIILNSCMPAGTAVDLQGGGVYCFSGASQKYVTFDNNVLDSNTVQIPAGQVGLGGGIKLDGVIARITGNRIAYNNLNIPELYANGVGAGLEFDNIRDGCLIRGNVFEGNQATQNAYPGFLGSVGGAMRLGGYSQDVNLVVSDNKFLRNISDRGGAFQFYGLHIYFYNNLFTENQAATAGGVGMLLGATPSDSLHLIFMVNNTFRNNIAGSGGAIASYFGMPLMLNCIFDHDSAADGSNEFYVFPATGSLEVAYSDLDTTGTGYAAGGYVIRGEGLMTDNPLFSDTSTLQTEHWSPCVDAGVPYYICDNGELVQAPDSDFYGFPRPVGNGYDMGAYDIEAWALGTGSPNKPVTGILNSPNPVSETTVFTYTLNEAGQVRLQLFDSYGRQVAEPVDGYQLQGQQTITYDASALPAGLYLYRLSAGKATGSGKLLKL